MRAERLPCDGDDFSSFTHSQLLICPLPRLLQIHTAAKKSQMFICAKRELTIKEGQCCCLSLMNTENGAPTTLQEHPTSDNELYSGMKKTVSVTHEFL